MVKTKFEVYKDGKGAYRWRLLAQNGEPVAAGGEGFKEKRSAMNSVKKMKEWASTTNIVDVEMVKIAALKAKEAAAKQLVLAKNKSAADKMKGKKVVAKPAMKSKVVAKKAVKKTMRPMVKKVVAKSVVKTVAPTTVSVI